MHGKSEEIANLAKLERQIHNLSKLVNINGIINSTLDITKLYTLIMKIIKDIMDTDASTLLIYDEETKELVFMVALGEAGEKLTEGSRVKLGQGIAGWVAETRKPLYVNDVYKDKRFDPSYDKDTGYKTEAILCMPLLFKGKLLGVIQAINPINRPGFDEDDIALFGLFADQAGLAVQNATFFHNALEEERIKVELSSASSIQESLIPDINNKFGCIHIAAKSISAREIGGEFHGLYQFDSANIGIALGDIHEKGIPGGLRAAIMSGALRALAGIKGNNPLELVKHLNNLIADDTKSFKKATLFYGVINGREKSLMFVNKGVAFPFLVRDSVARYLRFESKSSGNDTADLEQVIIKLKVNDIFVILTDGIFNIRNRSSQNISLKKVVNFLQWGFNSPEDVIDSLINYANEFSDGLAIREDISIMVFKVN